MTLFKNAITILLVFNISTIFAQARQEKDKITISGKIIEKSSSLPLEYATIRFVSSTTNKVVSGGITNEKGIFSIEIPAGTYNIKYEFISFKSIEVKDQNLTSNSNLGTISLEDEARKLDEVVIRAEKTTVDIKLDKKVYTVGKDIIVRGGTVSDVLDNVPSVSVDVEGKVSLRGNENVTILIDGKPSNAINISDALRLIPADAIDKVEVVTNPSARYDAEGGGGILNIILKRGKNQGMSGTIVLTAGEPENTGASANINVKSEQSNFFTTIGYNKRNNPGRAKIDQENFNSSGQLVSILKERRKSDRINEGLNANFGIEIYLTKTASWTNAMNLRINDGNNLEDVRYYNFNPSNQFVFSRQRLNDAKTKSENFEYTSNFIKKFKKDGHKLSIDFSASKNKENEGSTISGKFLESGAFVSDETTSISQDQNRNLIQLDYVLPINKDSQFEAGFRGNYVNLVTDFKVQERITQTSDYTNITDFTNKLEYVENVSAVYTQFGSKIKKFSYLLGLRYEDSHIEVNQFVGNDFNTKKYTNFFPSAFVTYEISDESSLSLNYSKRITRPRDRFINPFASYSSNINLFQGNPDINPAFSNVFDLGYLKKWEKITLSTSVYFNRTTDAFQIVRKERGDLINGIPVILNTPFNLAIDDRLGFEFTVNYNFKKWWKLNGNFNFFNNETSGDYSYLDTNNVLKNQNFDFKSSTWFTRITSKISLPYKIDWQTNATYNARQRIAQGVSRGVFSANLAFSKDILKDKATISFNINDLLNSRKMLRDLRLPNINSDSEMQFRVRSFNLSFTYRFNKKKTEERPKRPEGGEGEMMG